MSKQDLQNMLKSMANGNTEEAKEHFGKYASAKTQEILARGEPTAETQEEPTEVTEPEKVEEPITEPEKTEEEPTGDSTTA